MHQFSCFQIKSFKHNGHVHRIWMENWLVPFEDMAAVHQAESMFVLINNQTKIIEANGQEWTSKVPGVSFFIPKQWYNIIALIEDSGIRYYCNIASPPYVYEHKLTYIDYDLDVIVMPNREYQIVDQNEFEAHKTMYRYSDIVEAKIQSGLLHLLQRLEGRMAPFEDDQVMAYYELWKKKLR